MDQWQERIKQFLPSSRVGIIQGEIIDIEDKDIVLGMLQSISMKEYPHSLFQEFGLTILDEVHHLSAEVFSRALFKIVTQYMLGLSATMKRKDGLTHVFKMFLGDVIYSKKREIRKVCDYFCWNIVKLIRIQYGPYKLLNLKKGQISEIKEIIH